MKINFPIIILIVFFGGIILWAAVRSSPISSVKEAENTSEFSSGVLAADESSFDFGTISMAEGNVTHEFKIKNTGSEPVAIEKMYTSCMCTTASLMLDGKKFGPYGMPGHGFIPGINASVKPGEEVTIEAVFDPAAHGPAGVGRIQRIITIENNAGEQIELGFAAMVTP